VQPALAFPQDGAVGQVQDRVGGVHKGGVVGGEQRGHALGPDDGAEQAHDLLAGLGVQLPGGLVGQQQPGARRESTGDGHALLLAAGELARPVPGVAGQADKVSPGRRRC
jgi:hypothetical protein